MTINGITMSQESARAPMASLSGLQGGVGICWWPGRCPSLPLRRLEHGLLLLQASATSRPSLDPGEGLKEEIIVSLRGQRGSGEPHLPLDLDLMGTRRGSHDRAKAGRAVPLPRLQQEVASP